MYEIIASNTFSRWFDKIKDRQARFAVAQHLDRMAKGNFGVTRQVAGDIYEKKINVSGGYRVYYFIKKGHLIFLLCGGTKRTQRRDIEKARELRGET